ncbi:MAG: 4Fe-4S dicluster domain-containing protein, partial [bacterium]|nr:4Fe-4S dicluster domain-containing protein [bacterium]
MSCFNCGNAPCVIVCPTGAIEKRSQDGIVQVNPDLCIGCRSCL